MNIIEELVKKYEGSYSEEAARGITFSSGHYTFHPKKGIIEIDGTKISINIKAVGGAARTAEPYRIMLFLNKDYRMGPLEIFPKSTFKKIIGLFFPKNNLNIPPQIKKQFTFKGNESLLKSLLTDTNFCDKINDEYVYIVVSKKYPRHIVLTPAHGIEDLEQFEKFLNILKLIESKIISKSVERRISKLIR